MDGSSHSITQLIRFLHSLRTDNTRQSSNRPINALLIIDVQNDFINGTMALQNCPSKHNGEEVIPVINRLLDSINFDLIVYSYDWHPIDHISFFDNLPLRSHLLTSDSISLADLRLYSTATFANNGLDCMKQTLWPRHCVQNTFGAQLYPYLKIIDEKNNKNVSVIHIHKGTKSNIDSYSTFWDNSKLNKTALQQQLQNKHVTHVFVTGIATDFCVYSTAMHALENGYKTFIIEDACRGVDDETIKENLYHFTQKNGGVIHSSQMKYYIQ
ncbi:unnamed protein product [Rotaria sp. Silwood2]|nr:unnamed protein product [Rotaria sp. Silwood2]CAF3482557.1 unnamed protein product [Rotaria sp. Silwood2]CAF4328619.1 unnamed protein product [Rotaria sp. Silwood2]CAF4414532.1 unnamed protein product [Rotaria sp. Silwood2]